jgi:DNA repair protein RadC
MLELLLFYAIPRKDTNPLAHRLLQRFGSLAGVLDAPLDELRKVDGVGENAATLLKLVPQLAQQYEISKNDGVKILDTTTKAGNYLVPYFFGERDEVVYLLCLDAKCKVLACRELFRGGITSATVSARKIVEMAIGCNATSVVLAHNHPSGVALPSREDEAATRSIQRALDAVDILLADHIVVADGDFVSMADNGFFDR